MQRLFRVTLVTCALLGTVRTACCQDTADLREGRNLFNLEVDVPHYHNGFDIHRQSPDFGAPGSAAHGYNHFSGPLDRFTTWYRPRAATLTAWQRCAPDSFRPRGFGNLFNRPCDGYRMDYAPYTLRGSNSLYGPAYLLRMPDPRCQHCEHEDATGHGLGHRMAHRHGQPAQDCECQP